MCMIGGAPLDVLPDETRCHADAFDQVRKQDCSRCEQQDKKASAYPLSARMASAAAMRSGVVAAAMLALLRQETVRQCWRNALSLASTSLQGGSSKASI